MRSGFLALSCAAFCLSTQAFADDSSAALGAGGVVLTKSADIRMAREDLYVSPKKVRIRFEFVNGTDRDIDTVVAFPLPDVDMNEYTMSPVGAMTGDPLNFVGFTVTADGKAIVPQSEQRAFYRGRDVTDIVRRAGVPLMMTDPRFSKLMDKLPASQRRILEDAGLADSESGDFEHPHWTVRTRFFWHQLFPAHRTVVLEHAYQPVTGQSFFTGYELAGGKDSSAAYYARTYCIDPATHAAIARRIGGQPGKTDDGAMLAAYSTDYILVSGANWKGGIGHFHLTLDKLEPGNILSVCWDGALKKTGATTFEVSQDDFTPRQDVRMLVLGPVPKQ
ncbi:MAG TPA: DUF4424 family protein [Rhizomicrobium sp.]|nr:DUF4424 family protein [Rhizomicrobium sp.]